MESIVPPSSIYPSETCWFCHRPRPKGLSLRIALYKTARHKGSGIYKIEYVRYEVLIPCCLGCKKEEIEDNKWIGKILWVSLAVATSIAFWYIHKANPIRSTWDGIGMVLISAFVGLVFHRFVYWPIVLTMVLLGGVKRPKYELPADHPAVLELKKNGWTENPPTPKFSPKINHDYLDERVAEYSQQLHKQAQDTILRFGSATDNPFLNPPRL